MTHIECVLIAHWCTLQHIETHYSQGHFYVVLQQSQQCVSMCFNVFQCAKKHIEKTLEAHWSTFKVNVCAEGTVTQVKRHSLLEQERL